MVVDIATADRVGLRPDIPKAKGESCVEPTEVMRRRHMEFLLHHRDRTMYEGVRTKKHSLVECLNCHVQADQSGAYPRHTSTKHFCTTCHAFSNVSIDCFSCHADRPEAFYRDKMAGKNIRAMGKEIMIMGQ